MLPVLWRASARTALARIIHYIAKDNPAAARRLKDMVEASVLPLAQHPYLYRSGRVPGTREIVVHPNYILVYAVRAERIEVLHLLHARQQYPE